MDLSMLFSSFFSVLINILSKLEICWFEGLVCSSSKVKQSLSGCLKALLCSPWRSLLAGHFETWKPWLHNKSLNSRLQKSSNCVQRLAFVSAKIAVGTSCVMNHYKHFACTQAGSNFGQEWPFHCGFFLSFAVTSCRTFNTAIIKMTTNDKRQSHEPSMRSQRSKVRRNGKSCGGRVGRVVLGQEQILAPIVNIDNTGLQNIKTFIWNYFFTICAVYIDL